MLQINNHGFSSILEFPLSPRAKAFEPQVSPMFGNPLPFGKWIQSRVPKEPTALAMWGRNEMGEAVEGGLRQERHKLVLRRLWEEQG